MKNLFLFTLLLMTQVMLSQNLIETRTASLMDGDYLLQGTVHLELYDDNSLDVRFENDYLTTNNVFDVHVYLTNNNNYADPINTSGMLLVENIGSIDGIDYSSGPMTFNLPAGVGINDYQHIVFVCLQFGNLHWGDGTFGASEPTFSSFNFKLFLEGPYDDTSGEMTTALHSGNLIPLSQPFNVAPYNYNGSESVVGIPSADIVDWILIQARDRNNWDLVIESQACFLLKDGSLMDINGNNGIRFFNLNNGSDYRFAIYHKGHLGVLSAADISAGSTAIYDFSSSSTMAQGIQQTKSIGGVHVLHSGDYDNNGVVNNLDFNLWNSDAAAVNAYEHFDGDCNGVVNNQDFNLWNVNKSKVGETSIYLP